MLKLHSATDGSLLSHAHLYLSALNHGAVKTLSCSLRITTICECYKTESLHARQTKHALKTASLKKQRATKINIYALHIHLNILVKYRENIIESITLIL